MKRANNEIGTDSSLDDLLRPTKRRHIADDHVRRVSAKRTNEGLLPTGNPRPEKRQRTVEEYVYTDPSELHRDASVALVDGIHDINDWELSEILHIVGLDEEVVPKKFQLTGIRFLLGKYKESLKSSAPDAAKGCILADEMGLGKTLQTLCLMRASMLRKGGPMLVVTPKSVTQNWIEEIKHFFGHDKMRVLHYHGTADGWTSYTHASRKPVKSKAQPTRTDIQRHHVVLTHHDAIAMLWRKEVSPAAEQRQKAVHTDVEQDRVKQLPPGAPWFMQLKRRAIPDAVDKKKKREPRPLSASEKAQQSRRAETLVFENAQLGEGRLSKKVARFTRASTGLFSPLLTTVYSIIAADEAHAFRNADTERFKSHTMLRGDFFVAITGTPIINAKADTWALLKFMHAPNLCSLYDFQRSEKKAEQFRKRQQDDDNEFKNGNLPYAKYLRRKTGRKKTLMAQATTYLQQIMSTHMHRTSKADLYEGPAPVAPRSDEKLHTVGFDDVPHSWQSEVLVELKPCAVALCDSIANGAQEVIDGAVTQKQRFEACATLLAMINLKRVVSESAYIATPGLVKYCPQKLLDDAKKEPHAKQDALVVYIRERMKPTEKIVIFANFEGGVVETARTMAQNNIGVVQITGAVSQTNRAEMIKRFHEQTRLRVLVTTHCLSHGVNITCANHVGFLGPWWHQREEDQCMARLHRIGQREETHVVYFLVSGDSVDSRVRKVAAGKNNMTKLTFDTLASIATM